MPFPMELCNRLVTIYRPRKGEILRQEGKAFYHYKDIWSEGRFRRSCLLILPVDLELLPGDRIFDGIGPEKVEWSSFLPVEVPGLSQVRTASPYRFRDSFHHWEATA